MSVINRRNALLGWVTWVVGKRVIKYKAKQAAPSESTSKKKGAIALFVAGAVGALAFWKKRSGGDEPAELG